MENLHQNHRGEGDNVGRDKIINHIYINTKDYEQLEKELKSLQERAEKLQGKIKKYPNDDDFKREAYEVRGLISEQESKIESFKADIFRLYETFTKIEINTERLRLAKHHFEKGELREADAILKAEEISSEVTQLKEAKEKKESELSQINNSLEDKANEFFVKAQLWTTFYKESDWFEKTIEYYEKALDANRFSKIAFSYALFLQEHNQFETAQKLYEQLLSFYEGLGEKKSDNDVIDVAMLLHNIGNLYQNKGNFTVALQKYEEALDIMRKLIENDNQNKSYENYLPNLAIIMHSIAVLYSKCNELLLASEIYEEVLGIYAKLAEKKPNIYLPMFADALSNLANIQKLKNEFSFSLQNYKESLKIKRELAKQQPKVYLHKVATTLCSLAVLQNDNEELSPALKNCQEAVEIHRKLAIENPRKYLNHLAMTLNSLANIQEKRGRFSSALKNYEEVLSFYRKLPYSKHNEHYIAMTINNLAILQKKRNQIKEAVGNFYKAFDIWNKLYKKDSKAYILYMAAITANLGSLHTHTIPNKDKAIYFSFKVIEMTLPMYEEVPKLRDYMATALYVLQTHNIDIGNIIEKYNIIGFDY